MNDRSYSVIRGALSGFLATIPMTLVMEGLRRALPPQERYPLPPRVITANAAAGSGVRSGLTHEQEQELAWTAHYLFGTSMGAAYGLLNAGKQKHAIKNGALLGWCVWAMSYQGWLPAFDLHPAATEEPMRRNILMVVAHLVWGISTSEIHEFLRKMSERDIDGANETSVEKDAQLFETGNSERQPQVLANS